VPRFRVQSGASSNAKALGPELVQVMKDLRLGQILHTLADRIDLAEKDELPLQDFLLGLLSDEVERRRETSTARRAHDAGLDPDMALERWDKTAKVTYDRRVLQELVSLRFVEAQRNVVVLGPVGRRQHLHRQRARACCL
jgi:DNA replication protein DnaC